MMSSGEKKGHSTLPNAINNTRFYVVNPQKVIIDRDKVELTIREPLNITLNVIEIKGAKHGIVKMNALYAV